MKIRENVSLSKLTTMRLGGPARFLIEIEKEEEIPEAVRFIAEKKLPVFILGGGANTIAKDEGFPGIILKNNIKGIEISAVKNPGLTDKKEAEIKKADNNKDGEEFLLTANGGEEWDMVVATACEAGLTGIEGLSKIPGLAGAAPVQNIGAYGQDIAQTFVSSRVYDLKTNEFKILSAEDFKFSYRKSILNTSEKQRYFVINICLKLKHGEMARPFYNSVEKFITEHNWTDFSPSGVREIVSKIRADKLPDPKERASAGSFFKNVYLSEAEAKKAEEKGYPVYRGHDGLKINSGWLIQECGLLGQLICGFRVNEKAALVLINESAESYSDLEKARAEIIEKVFDKFGYRLEQEPVEIG